MRAIWITRASARLRIRTARSSWQTWLTSGSGEFFSQCCRSGSGSRCLFDPWIRDPGWVKKSGSESGMNNPDHISESLETPCWVKIFKFFDADPGWKIFGSGIQDKHPGSATLFFSRLAICSHCLGSVNLRCISGFVTVRYLPGTLPRNYRILISALS
jgi:hypothetical protein